MAVKTDKKSDTTSKRPYKTGKDNGKGRVTRYKVAKRMLEVVLGKSIYYDILVLSSNFNKSVTN